MRSHIIYNYISQADHAPPTKQNSGNTGPREKVALDAALERPIIIPSDVAPLQRDRFWAWSVHGPKTVILFLHKVLCIRPHYLLTAKSLQERSRPLSCQPWTYTDGVSLYVGPVCLWPAANPASSRYVCFSVWEGGEHKLTHPFIHSIMWSTCVHSQSLKTGCKCQSFHEAGDDVIHWMEYTAAIYSTRKMKMNLYSHFAWSQRPMRERM